MFVDALVRGLAAGGWVIGFLASVGGFSIIIFGFCAVICTIVGDEDIPSSKEDGQ